MTSLNTRSSRLKTMREMSFKVPLLETTVTVLGLSRIPNDGEETEEAG